MKHLRERVYCRERVIIQLLSHAPVPHPQEFVHHGGTMQKLYVIGSYVTIQQRKSVAVDTAAMGTKPDYERLGRISCVQRTPHGERVKPKEVPQAHRDMPNYRRLGAALRERYQLDIFNADILTPEEQPNDGSKLFYLVDVNYFPGVNKVAGY